MVDATLTPRQITGGLVERHLDTMNILWADGHVKAVRFDALLSKPSNLVAGGLAPFSVQADPE